MVVIKVDIAMMVIVINVIIRMDVSAAIVGNNPLTVAACKNDAVWGELCSSTVPFDFNRPAAPTTPGNIRLTP